jgi:hypothetical protein
MTVKTDTIPLHTQGHADMHDLTRVAPGSVSWWRR